MKKFITIMLILAMILSLVACGSAENGGNSDKPMVVDEEFFVDEQGRTVVTLTKDNWQKYFEVIPCMEWSLGSDMMVHVNALCVKEEYADRIVVEETNFTFEQTTENRNIYFKYDLLEKKFYDVVYTDNSSYKEEPEIETVTYEGAKDGLRQDDFEKYKGTPVEMLTGYTLAEDSGLYLASCMVNTIFKVPHGKIDPMMVDPSVDPDRPKGYPEDEFPILAVLNTITDMNGTLVLEAE